MTPEPLRGPALRSALAAILARPVTDLPRPEETEHREASIANGRKGAAATVRVWAVAKAKAKAKGTSKGRPKFDHEAAMQRAREGATPAQLAQEFGVSDRSIYNLLSREWPDRPKLSKHDKGAAP